MSWTGQGKSAGPRLAVVFSRFPVWNQTFALADVQELGRAGFQVEIFALLGAKGSIQQPAAKDFQERIHHWRAGSWSFVRANLKAWCRGVTWRLLLKVLSGTLVSPWELVKSLALFPPAVYFADVMQRNGIQHIHAGWASYPATVAWIASELAEIPFSFYAHAYDIYKVRSLLPEKIHRARFVATCAETNREALVSVGGEQARPKIHVHRHGVDLKLFYPIAPSLPEPNAVWEVLACGNLVSYKGFNHLIHACYLLRERGCRFVCSIIGEGSARDRLARQIRLFDLSAEVRLLRPMPQPELAQQYRKADVFVLPSVVTRDGNRDVIPNVLVEAMASGIPVISTRLAGIQELIQDGKNGLLVPPGDAEALAEGISSLMKERQQREQLVEAAKEMVSDAYDRRKNAEGLIQTFATHIPCSPYPPVEGGPLLVSEVLSAISRDHEVYFPGVREPPRVISTSLEHRRLSNLARVKLQLDGRTTDIYIKFHHHPQSPEWRIRAKAQTEFETLKWLSEAFARVPGCSVVRPIGYFSEYKAVVTEKSDGINLHSSLNSALRTFLGVHGKRAEEWCYQTGHWLRNFQEITERPEKERFEPDRFQMEVEEGLQRCEALGFSSLSRGRIIAWLRLELSRLGGLELKVVGQHPDFQPQNILVGPHGITVLDFTSFKFGNCYHDVAGFLTFLDSRLKHPLFRTRRVGRLQESFLRGYRVLSPHDRLLRLYRVKEMLNYCTTFLSRTPGPVWSRSTLQRFFLHWAEHRAMPNIQER